ncbi:MAG TPA: hypothetical protein VD905_01535 [Flavobacteriales bacterium]|nr:hypothetical protein [Flavobacteriales bacterium]
MKKWTILLLALSGTITGSANFSGKRYNETTPATLQQDKHNWRKSGSGTWTGKYNGEEYIFKMKSGQLMQQRNGGDWTEVSDGVWYDYNGNRYRYRNNMVSSSSDGTNWTNVDGGYWQGNNGYWYKMDKNGTLWWDYLSR